MKKTLWICGTAVLMIVVVLIVGVLVNHNTFKNINQLPPTQAWNIYNGESGEYYVEIDESDHGQGFSRIVHLKPKGSAFAKITGHDYNNDGKWDAIFFCDIPDSSYGCNSFERDRTGGWVYKPCEAAKDKPNPFLLGDVISARQQLDDAMAIVHNIAHRTSTLEEWRKRSKN